MLVMHGLNVQCSLLKRNCQLAMKNNEMTNWQKTTRFLNVVAKMCSSLENFMII